MPGGQFIGRCRTRHDSGALGLCQVRKERVALGLDVQPVLLAERRNPLLRLLPRIGVAPALLGLGGVLLAEGRRPEDLDLFFRGQLDTFAVCVHQFLHCFDGVFQPICLLEQQRVLPLQMRKDVGVCVVEQSADLIERQADGPVHQHQVQPLDVGVGVSAIARRGTDAGHHKTDVVVVMQRAYGDAGEGWLPRRR